MFQGYKTAQRSYPHQKGAQTQYPGCSLLAIGGPVGNQVLNPTFGYSEMTVAIGKADAHFVRFREICTWSTKATSFVIIYTPDFLVRNSIRFILYVIDLEWGGIPERGAPMRNLTDL